MHEVFARIETDTAALQGQRGIAAGRAASAADTSKPHGYFWTAACMGALAEAHGLRQGIKSRAPIREALA